MNLGIYYYHPGSRGMNHWAVFVEYPEGSTKLYRQDKDSKYRKYYTIKLNEHTREIAVTSCQHPTIENGRIIFNDVGEGWVEKYTSWDEACLVFKKALIDPIPLFTSMMAI